MNQIRILSYARLYPVRLCKLASVRSDDLCAITLKKFEYPIEVDFFLSIIQQKYAIFMIQLFLQKIKVSSFFRYYTKAKRHV